MTHKRWKSDGPPLASQPFIHHWGAFQGKAYPNPYNGDLDADQARLDRERARAIELQKRREDWETKRLEKHMAKRRREKTGRRS